MTQTADTAQARATGAETSGAARRSLRDLLFRLGFGLGTRGLEVAGKMALYVLVARQLSMAEAGLYFTALAWATMGGTLGRLGLERAAMALIPAELALQDGAAALRVLRRVIAGGALSGMVMGLATALLGPVVAISVMDQPALAGITVMAGLLLLGETLSMTVAGVLVGLHRNVASQLVGASLWPTLALGGLLLWQGAALNEALLVTVLARFATTLLGAAMIWQSRRVFAATRVAEAPPMPTLLRMALPLLGVELVQVALVTTPTLILAALASPEAVAAFSMAMRLSVLTWVVLISVATIAAPRIAEQYRRREWDRLRQTQRMARWTSAALALPALAVMAVAAPWLLDLLGPGFDVATTALRILCLGQTVNALFACRDTLLANTGHGDDLLRTNLVQFVLAAMLAATAVPTFGAEGAAAMAAISTGFGALATSWMARRRVPKAF